MDFYVVQALSGLASASSLFLVASGLSLIFGVTRIVNFAHGSLFMIGAYLAWTLVQVVGFWPGIGLAALGVAVLGAVLEVGLLRRIYQAPELFQLLATFAVVLVVQDAVVWIWGPEDLLGPLAPGLDGAVSVLGLRVPEYDLLLIALGPAVLGVLWLVLTRTRWGVLVRAATEDREMVAALGVDQRKLFTGVFALGSLLAGLGGAVQLPREAVHHAMDLTVIVDAFVVVVIGGLGSIPGAFLASVLIGELNAFGILVFPRITLVLAFLVMAVVLVVRPQGLLGRSGGHPRGAMGPPEAPLAPLPPAGRLAFAVVLAALVALPLVGDAYAVSVATEVAIFALFAVSLHMLIGVGGMLSFGHAAVFGLGAYGSALAVKLLGLPFLAALLAAPLTAAVGAAVAGWFCVRLSGVYLAMLTLAFAQIVWSVAFQWTEVTGGDNGLLGLWPPRWAGRPEVFYWLTLAVVVAAIAALRHLVFTPFGQALRACRDNPRRAEAIGISVQGRQWMGFVVAGTFAGLAGGLFAFFKGSVFPSVAAIPLSVDGLVMVLLGGIQTLTGPLVGAAAYKLLHVWLAAQTDAWRAVLGGVILVLVVAFPRGIVGALRARFGGGGAA